MSFWIGFLAGLFIGTFFGAVLIALARANGPDEGGT